MNGDDIDVPFNNNNFDRDERVAEADVEVEGIGKGWWTSDVVGLEVDCWGFLERDPGISKSRSFPFSSSVLDEFPSSDETIKSTSDDDDEISWSDSMRIGSRISLLFKFPFVFKEDNACDGSFF